ncbi:hypothetical protein OG883_17000 [Streptomyces sp. NBC_01142]|uniref:hypothetical protein n=1 Tax=Streptomyces sp. NBC_01142 TaxID=2975865 RepID=UPI00225C32C9|nr:hypothetical protein [Streptomyces sp. NBC_01142]MCX4821560.1 hypothetical protein [Streptomyces sp. NBC_01142]
MPESMEGVSAEDWGLLVEHEYTHRAALDEARRNVEAELARPRERNLSNLGITVVASLVFGVIAVALFTMGFGWWSLLPVAMLVPALVLALHFAPRVLRPEPETPGPGSGSGPGTSGSGVPG